MEGMIVYAFKVDDLELPDEWLYATPELAKAAAEKSAMSSILDTFNWVKEEDVVCIWKLEGDFQRLYIQVTRGILEQMAHITYPVKVYEEGNF